MDSKLTFSLIILAPVTSRKNEAVPRNNKSAYSTD
jgi:hypothetical protein